jgi:competence protein ComEA
MAKALPLVGLVGVIVALVVVVLFTMNARSAPAPLLVLSTPAAPAAATRSGTPQTSREIKVYVAGAVAHPGVYSFQKGDRVDDAVKAAGGMTTEADPDHVNLAASLVDGQEIDVPRLSATNTPAPSRTPAGKRGASTPSSAPVNINTATVEELVTLPGVGPVTARDIVDYRQRHGPFNSVADLLKVPVHRSVFERIKDRVTVDG